MKTVRVRIPVEVTQEGEWSAGDTSHGPCGDETQEQRDQRAVDCLWESLCDDSGRRPTGTLITWIEADVPLPERVTVEGRVT